jgi:hypothetical protein
VTAPPIPIGKSTPRAKWFDTRQTNRTICGKTNPVNMTLHACAASRKMFLMWQVN